jgi:guanosine-3',5'-bis(diphosphate) 3'-pyrophosphohydrolase
MSFEQLVTEIERYHPSPDLVMLQAAYEFGYQQHLGQVRASGEPYFNHLIETALLGAKLKLDVPSIVAALLHDSIEDCLVTREDIERKFSADIADIVEAVTKLTRIEFQSKEEKQAENFRKMLLAMAKDIRVILVKLCDRLHNMRTLGYLPEEKRRIIADETKEIYAPLANRLGIHWLKSELEDLCLLHLRPEIYNLIQSSFTRSSSEREQFVSRSCKDLTRVLEESGVSAAVKGRSKHFFSIWQKMEEGNLAFEEVHDVLGFRIIVPTVRACYETLGIIHATYKPVPNRVKDFIAMPKPNMYQSLHTTVIGPEAQRIEVQIRTPEMNIIAEEGIAAHWRYKEGGVHPSMDLQWVRDLVETQQYLKNPDEFIQSVKGELFPEEVFVFTPKGALFRLPYKATPIDFAYAVHTDIGHRATGAKVNNQIVTLDYKLQNGDVVEILTLKSHVPSKDWLKFVQSSKAKQRIRAFLKSEEHARSLVIGSDILAKDLRKVKLSLKKLEASGRMTEIAQQMGLKGEGELFAEIGYGKIATSKVIAKLLPEGANIEEQLEKKESPLQRIFQRAAQASRRKVGVTVNGFDDILVRFAKCCEPLPGDRIVGFITRGRGVSVHYADCPHALEMDTQRIVEVHWDDELQSMRKVRLIVHSQDQMGLLANMCKAITDSGANIVAAHAKTSETGKAENSFEITIGDAKHFDKVKRSLEMVPGVIKVLRVSTSEGGE